VAIHGAVAGGEVVVKVREALIEASVVIVKPLAEFVELLKDDLQTGVHHTKGSLPVGEVVVGGGSSEIQGVEARAEEQGIEGDV
jgi:hypothetical protein